MSDYLREMIAANREGRHCGIPSYCTANSLVLEALLEQAKRFDSPILLEATSNQVNQYGGYTGMVPEDYSDLVYMIAEQIGFPREKIILGGDHLGPLVWSEEPESIAMAKAIELVKCYVMAGYKKIHLDTSMKLGDDDPETMLSTETIARRGAILYQACEEAYQELKKENPEEVRPVYIIGSEVPIPGGSQESEDHLTVTKPEAVEDTICLYREAFSKAGFPEAFENVIGIVVQPGVEFGDAEVHRYNREEAKELCDLMRGIPGIIMEGHSTDYQTAENLREMVEDGIAILKVGPALTFAMREGLFALSMMEKELVPKEQRARFQEILESVMVDQPKQWVKHYHGTEAQLKLKRRYSMSDRCRYYMSRPEVMEAIEKLFRNLRRKEFSLGMIHQYMPCSYRKVCNGEVQPTARALLKDYIVNVADDYNYAVKETL